MSWFRFERSAVLILVLAGVLTAQTRVNLSQTNASFHQNSVTGQVSATKGFNAPLAVVPFSVTPTFDASAANVFTLTLAGNVTSSTLIRGLAGQLVTFRICQDSAGGHSFFWPSNFHGGGPVTTAPSACSQQSFVHDGINADALGPMAVSSVSGGMIILPGVTSGTTSIQPAAVASGALTLPAATDTLVGKATTDTLTNKIINGVNNTLLPTSAQTISGFSGTCDSAHFLRADGSCQIASGTAASITSIDPTYVIVREQFLGRTGLALASAPMGPFHFRAANAANVATNCVPTYLTIDHPGCLNILTTATADTVSDISSGYQFDNNWTNLFGSLSGQSWELHARLLWPTLTHFRWFLGWANAGDLRTEPATNAALVRFSPMDGDTGIGLRTCGNSCGTLQNTGFAPLANTWYRVVLTYASGTLTLKIYDDGGTQLGSTVTSSANLPSATAQMALFLSTRNDEAVEHGFYVSEVAFGIFGRH
jgi:hypothetical protein